MINNIVTHVELRINDKWENEWFFTLKRPIDQFIRKLFLAGYTEQKTTNDTHKILIKKQGLRTKKIIIHKTMANLTKELLNII